MSTLEALTGSPFLSYSSLESWLTCGERYRLEKVVGVHQKQAWYLLGGSAVHEATELLDKGDIESPDEAWATAWAKQLATVENPADVRAGGRASKAWPEKENKDWWEENGPLMVRNYHAYMRQLLGNGWQIAGVETKFELILDGDVLLRGFIDRVMINPNGEAEVHDIKTGTRAPAWTLQLGAYSLGAQQAFGFKPTLGRYYMARQGETTPPASLLHYTPELLSDWFGKARKAIEAEVFVPHVTAMCTSCSVRDYCAAVGGSEVSPFA